MSSIDPAHVIWSTPVAERAGKPLLVLLHGLGSDEGGLFRLSPYLPLDHVIASPRGPIASGEGWSWFDVAAPRPAPLNAAADALAEWIATARGDASSVAVLGFSQGGVLGLQALRRHPETIDALVLLSAIADETVDPGDPELEVLRPPVFWGRGTSDRVVPADQVMATRAWLEEHSTLTERIYEDVGHWITDAELGEVHTFLRGVFPIEPTEPTEPDSVAG
ncbi:alpha/beta hydrolase [Lysinimonas soli]|uniref:Alpha/beta hydrolase n=1 Tax=Lysinimonas soli TaxID=1074233 RepID=A0ABW0NRN9_9MICO